MSVKKDTWCQTTESARNKWREPDIDHSVNHENTTQEDHMQQAADDLVNQQTITQYESHCQKCGNVRSEAEHHSVCWQCWYRISENNGRAEQAIDEINSIDGCQISATDISHTTEINMEPNHWYRLAKRFEGPDEKNANDTAMKCATCSITNVLVSQQEIQTHCTNSSDCMRTDVRDSARTWKSSELHVRKDDDDNYDWSHTIDTQAEDTSDGEENFQIFLYTSVVY